jgi:hypothetical protein
VDSVGTFAVTVASCVPLGMLHKKLSITVENEGRLVVLSMPILVILIVFDPFVASDETIGGSQKTWDTLDVNVEGEETLLLFSNAEDCEIEEFADKDNDGMDVLLGNPCVEIIFGMLLSVGVLELVIVAGGL